jgi:predicted MFS family arabinose efflux permease
MAHEAGLMWYGALFLLYGLYAAATEGISKAWIVNVVRREDSATAIGFFAGFQSLGALLASSLTGLVWYAFGTQTAFIATGAMTVVVLAYMTLLVPAPKNE